MIIIYLFLFCSSAYSADYSADFDLAMPMFNDCHHRLRPGMWGGTLGYTVPTQELVPLTDENISTPFFVELKKKSAQKKGKLLKLAKKYPDGDYNYRIRRRNIAALVKIAETDPKVVQNEFEPDLLYQATLNQDSALVTLLLGSGADVHERTRLDNKPTPIHFAESVPLVQLFEKYGAFKHESASLLLHTAMGSKYDIALVPYYKEQYKKYNLNLFGVDEFRRNILMGCISKISVSSAGNEAIEKVKSLFQDLPDETVVAMINYSNPWGNVMQYIQKESAAASPRVRNVLTSLQTLLQSRLDSACKKESTKEEQEIAECAICLETLVQSIVTKCCKQSLHSDCLQKCIALGNGCPLCRSAQPQ